MFKLTKPSHKSTHLRKIFYRTPGGKTKTRYERKKMKKVSCAVCGVLLQGVSSEKKLSKTRKRPGRKFAGNLCANCVKEIIKLKTRLEEKQISLPDIDPKYRKFL